MNRWLMGVVMGLTVMGCAVGVDDPHPTPDAPRVQPDPPPPAETLQGDLPEEAQENDVTRIGDTASRVRDVPDLPVQPLPFPDDNE